MDKQEEELINAIGNLRTKEQAQAFQDFVNGSIITIAEDGDITFHNCGGLTMNDIERVHERAMEVESRLSDIRCNIKSISDTILVLSETVGNATNILYDLESMLDELNEKEADHE